MATRLGLDIGTNSIGWCLYDGDNIKDIGVRIFGQSPHGAGRDPKSGASLAVDRRDARAMRRRRDRYVRRRSALLEALVDTGLMPADAQDAKALVGCDPYAVRAAALDEALNPHHLGRALFHLNQRRGFKSNRKAERKAGDDKEGGKIATGAKVLDLAMQETGARTYGEFLAGREAKRVRMRAEGDGYDFYPERRHLEAEFDAIWATQATHHPALLIDAVRDRLRRIIFFQRLRQSLVTSFPTRIFAGRKGFTAPAFLRSSAALASMTQVSPPSRQSPSMSMMYIIHCSLDRCSTFSISIMLRCYVGPRAPCSAAMPWLARSTWLAASRA